MTTKPKTPKTDALVGDFPFPWDHNTEMLVRHAEAMERLLIEVYMHGENGDLHERIRVLLGIEE